MKTFIYLILTSLISTGIYMAALNSQNVVPGIAAALGLWVWFLWGCDRRRKRAADRRRF